MKQKEILLFGATGQIGRNLIRKLTNKNYKIIAVTRNIHTAGYILKTQANPGYLDLVEIKNFQNNKIDDLFDRSKIEARWIPSTNTFTVPSGNLSICSMLATHPTL